jgi:hypothetical protein
MKAKILAYFDVTRTSSKTHLAQTVHIYVYGLARLIVWSLS